MQPDVNWLRFFLSSGPVAGLVVMLVATVMISIVCGLAFEFARTFGLYDYRSFFRRLLGGGWIFFETTYLAFIILVLSVLGAASGELLSALFDIAPFWGTVVLMAAIALLVFWGGTAIEYFLSCWSLILYATYAVLIVWSIARFGDSILVNVVTEKQLAPDLTTLHDGVAYAGYNIAVFTTVLFVARRFNSRADALRAGLLCGPIGMIPGFFLSVAMIAHYPAVVQESLPISYLLDQLQAPGFIIAFRS